MKDLTLAFTLHEDGRKNFLGIFYKEDRDAFGTLFDEMQNMRQKDSTINHFGFEDIPVLGGLSEDIKYLYPE